jgi:uncharacterized protein (TIGR02217 family)
MGNEVFSYTLDTPFSESIQFFTIVSEGESGKEQRYQKWLKPRRTFRVKLDARQVVETDSIWRFYTRMKGSFNTFLFQNPNENPVTAETIGSGDGVRSLFYLGGKVDFATGDLIVVSGSESLTRSVKGTGDYLAYSTYTINNNTGAITTSPALPSGDVLRATSYRFYYSTRFKDDNISREAFTGELWNYGMELQEII